MSNPLPWLDLLSLRRGTGRTPQHARDAAGAAPLVPRDTLGHGNPPPPTRSCSQPLSPVSPRLEPQHHRTTAATPPPHHRHSTTAAGPVTTDRSGDQKNHDPVRFRLDCPVRQGVSPPAQGQLAPPTLHRAPRRVGPFVRAKGSACNNGVGGRRPRGSLPGTAPPRRVSGQSPSGEANKAEDSARHDGRPTRGVPCAAPAHFQPGAW